MGVVDTDLELKGNNLFRNGYIVEFANGEQLFLRDKIVWKGNTEDEYYTLKQWDRLDLLAYKKYSNVVEDASKYWWVIADANNIHNPLNLTAYVGKEIIIPNILNVLMKL